MNYAGGTPNFNESGPSIGTTEWRGGGGAQGPHGPGWDVPTQQAGVGGHGLAERAQARGRYRDNVMGAGFGNPMGQGKGRFRRPPSMGGRGDQFMQQPGLPQSLGGGI